MDKSRWSEILTRIVPTEAEDIDNITGDYDPRKGPTGRDIFPAMSAVLMPEAALKRADAVCVGVRITDELSDTTDRAISLATFALEKDAEVIVLSETDTSGYERFGFRVERLSGETPEELASCEDQIRRFWNLDLIL